MNKSVDNLALLLFATKFLIYNKKIKKISMGFLSKFINKTHNSVIDIEGKTKIKDEEKHIFIEGKPHVKAKLVK